MRLDGHMIPHQRREWKTAVGTLSEEDSTSACDGVAPLALRHLRSCVNDVNDQGGFIVLVTP